MKKILMAHDGSKYADKALRRAAELAARFDSTLVILSVIPEMHLTELSPIDRGRLEEALEREARKNLAKAESTLRRKALPVKTVVAQGNAAEVILDTARRVRAHLIVVGSHGRHGVERFLLGSVSTHVVKHADRSVMVVK